MYRFLPRLCHYWPGITPFNVWDLDLRELDLFMETAQSWSSPRKD